MKVYILPLDAEYRPSKGTQDYPPHNSSNFDDAETDFYNYLQSSQHILCDTPEQADFHYLPIFWARYIEQHLSQHTSAQTERKLEKIINDIVIAPSKTIIIWKRDTSIISIFIKMIVFSTSRITPNSIDIPLLCAEHKPINNNKWLKASFMGRIMTHPIRSEMCTALKKHKDCLLYNGVAESEIYRDLLCQSYISLCPRGWGANSYRFFESMQLGVVPLHIGEPDIRPFKKYINWDKLSLYRSNTENLSEYIDSFTTDQLIKMGDEAQKIYYNELAHGIWPKYVFKELQDILDGTGTSPEEYTPYDEYTMKGSSKRFYSKLDIPTIYKLHKVGLIKLSLKSIRKWLFSAKISKREVTIKLFGIMLINSKR